MPRDDDDNAVEQFANRLKFANLEKLMETLILMSALLLAFAISLPGAVSFDDLTAADQRCLMPGNNTKFFNNWCKSLSGEMSISRSFLVLCQVACVTLGIPTCALFVMVGGAALTPEPVEGESAALQPYGLESHCRSPRSP